MRSAWVCPSHSLPGAFLNLVEGRPRGVSANPPRPLPCTHEQCLARKEQDAQEPQNSSRESSGTGSTAASALAAKCPILAAVLRRKASLGRESEQSVDRL